MSYNYYDNVSPSYLQGMEPQQQMMPRHLQQQQQHLFNPNANAFVPRQQPQQPSYAAMQQPNPHMHYGQPNSFNYQQPSYGNASMYRPQQQPIQQQQQQQQFDYNDYGQPAMTSFYPGDDLGFDQYGFAQQQQYVATNDLREQHQKSENYKEIQEILVGLEQLLPGGEDFNSWALAIKDRMSSKHMSIEAKKLAIQTACEMATMVTPPPMPYSSHSDYQAQYTMARIVAFLANEVPELMAAAILPVLEQTHTGRPKAGTFQQKANLLMFFSDLYTRLETEVAGKKLPPLADAVIVQMKDFLHPSNVSDESMKLLLQVLKLAGRDLDGVPAVYDSLCQLLSTLMGYANGHPKLSETIKAQIKDLIDQRNKGWGPATTKTTPSVYCADGSMLELNDDESKFLEECLEGESSSQFSVNDPSDTSLDEADVMNEFDSFMKEEALMECTMTNMINDLSLQEQQKKDDEVNSTTPQPPKDEEKEKSS